MLVELVLWQLDPLLVGARPAGPAHDAGCLAGTVKQLSEKSAAGVLCLLPCAARFRQEGEPYE